MKRVVGYLLLVGLVLIITSCAQKGDNKLDGKYNDGEYDGAGDSWEYGSENATVKIENNKVVDITLRRLDTEGNEVNYEEWTGGDRPNLKQARVDMVNEMIEQQTYEVDSISGATITSDNWKVAVKRALEKSKK